MAMQILILIGAVMLAGVLGYVVGQRRSVSLSSPQETHYAGEIKRLRRRASTAERSHKLASRDLERVRRRSRIAE